MRAISVSRSSTSQQRATISAWACPACGGTIRDKRGECAACWKPNEGPQTRFLSLTCLEALYGGAAGGGKSDALLVDAGRYIGRGYGANYSALLLRREFPDLEKSLIVKSHDLYPRWGGRYREDKKYWRFPGGERVYFGHAQHEKDIHQYQGAPFQFIGFDELTTFTLYQYLYMLSRLRSAFGVPLRQRGATNPGGEGHEWVFRRFGPWLDPESPVHGEPGKVLYFVKNGDVEEVVSRDEAKRLEAARAAETGPSTQERMPLAIGRTFVPARLSDNPNLSADGAYNRSLGELDAVTRAQLRDGNWLIKPSKGMYFKRGYFQFVDAAPADAVKVRHWDRAATEAKQGRDPDWTVGLKLSRASDGIYYVENVVRFRESPHRVEASIKTTTELDGKGCTVHLAQDPGSAGKFEAAYYVRELAGYIVKTTPETGDKVTRAQPVSSQAEAGNIRIVRGPWNEAFIQELEQFPEGAHDDQVDALSGAFSVLHPPKSYVGSLDIDWMSR